MASFKKVLNFLFFLAPLLLIWAALVWKNYTFGTWLSGWDNLHPEFNFPLNISRSISSAWQEYQGLGLLGGMGHAADLPRQLILWAASLVIPLSLIRYSWTFLMLLLGPLGVYFLISRILLRDEGNYSKNLSSLVGSVFYLLNLATLQYFFTPYESFVSFYGFLPWLILFALNFLKLGDRRNLLKFTLISFLAIPSFYIQTLFIVYLVVLFLFAVEVVIKNKFSDIKRVIALCFVIVSVNAFWLLPAGYFSLMNSKVVTNAHQNSIATPETQVYNEARGNLSDIALLKGYWFDYYDLGQNNQFDYLYASWIKQIENKDVVIWAYVLFGVSIFGILLQILNRKSLLSFSPLILLVLVYFMLATTNPPSGSLFSFISQKIPLFSEVFRNVFTKWSTVAALVYSIGLAFFINIIGKVLSRSFLKVFVLIPVIALSFGALLIVKPFFEGNLISKAMEVKIPQEYFQAMGYLNSQSEGRVFFAPIPSFWGWNFYKWGYRGSGFLWYGVKQPILDRAFDVWSPYNEGFYNEASFALYSNDNEAFLRTLKKYQVRYILLDESIINAGGDDKLLFIPQIKTALSGLKETARFGFLTIYDTGFDVGDKFISAPQSFSKVNANLDYSQVDQIYSKYGNYIQDKSATSYPFVNFDKRGDVKISISSDSITLENRQANAKVTLSIKDVITESFSQDRGFPEGYNCDLKKKGEVVKRRLGSENYYASYNGGVSCDYFYYPTLRYGEGYILRIKGENLKGRGLKIYLQNIASGKMDLEELLPTGSFDETFAILPKPSVVGDQGYTLNVETRSFGRIPSENIIEKIGFYPVNLEFLETLKDTFQDSLQDIRFKAPTLQDVYSIQNNLKILNVHKFGTWLYKVDIQGSGLIELGQGYDKGWKAFLIVDSQWLMSNKLEHVKVNSWENGWILTEQSTNNNQLSTIFIVFWPQLLEYLGFVLLAGTLVLVLTKRQKTG